MKAFIKTGKKYLDMIVPALEAAEVLIAEGKDEEAMELLANVPLQSHTNSQSHRSQHSDKNSGVKTECRNCYHKYENIAQSLNRRHAERVKRTLHLAANHDGVYYMQYPAHDPTSDVENSNSYHQLNACPHTPLCDLLPNIAHFHR